jgi:hypothetical protein
MLRTLYSDVLNEPIPPEMIELLQRLDEPGRRGQDVDKA